MHLRQKLGEILDRASVGERIVIERDHKPLAMLVSYEEGMQIAEPSEDRARRIRAAFEKLAELRDRMGTEHGRGGPGAVETIREERARDDRGRR